MSLILKCFLLFLASIFSFFQAPALGMALKHNLKLGRGFVATSVVFEPNGSTFVVASSYDVGEEKMGRISFFSVKTGKLLATINGHNGGIYCLLFSPDGRYLISGGEDKKCIIWNPTTREKVGEFSGHTEAIYNLSVNLKDPEVITSSQKKTIIFWNLRDQKKIGTFQAHDEISSMAHSPDGKHLAVGDGGVIRILDTKQMKEVGHFYAHGEWVYDLVFIPNKKLLASVGGDDGLLKFWDTRHWDFEFEINHGRNKPIRLATTQEGNFLAVGFFGGDVAFHNISEPAMGIALPTKGILPTRMDYWVHNYPITVLSIRSDGKVLVAGSLERVKVLVDLPKFKNPRQKKEGAFKLRVSHY